jgi:hypothetical protein
LTPGSHVIELSQSGYRAWRETVQITPGRVTYVSASLEAATER